jgi:hypothetical protein
VILHALLYAAFFKGASETRRDTFGSESTRRLCR